MRFIYCLPVVLSLALGPLPGRAQKHAPTFAAYRVSGRYGGPHQAPILLPNTAAWKYRTRIREAAKGPPNFTGHYVLATWGCGIECLIFGIIDLETGKVWCDDRSVCCWGYQPGNDFEPIRFRLNSRLLILGGRLGEEEPSGTHYFKFEGGRLVALR